jgi:diguanylate cyclase (GGDEF)-like protein
MSEHDDSHFRFSLLLREIENIMHKEDVSAVALALIQLDGMEEINERFGYLGGDKVLKEFAVRLAGVVGHKGLTFEISGTAFALLLENPLHEGDAVSGAERIAKIAADPVQIGTGKASVHARMGISLLPEPAATPEELLRQCEIALSQARRRGETYRVFTPHLAEGLSNSNVQGGQSWFDVDEAIRQSEFELHYQPRINLRSGRLIGTEALIRWQSPNAGTIPPSYFMPDITSTESVRAMLDFVLNSALESTLDWVTRVPDFTLSVNLAPGNVLDPELQQTVERGLERWEFPPDRLFLEISEAVLEQDEETAVVALTRLRDCGVRISLDDFGTGYFRLSSMKNLPIDQIKIDETLVTPIPSNEKDRRLVGALVQLAHAVDMEVVAEGVEDDDIMQTLLSIGCEAGEGYHFSRPVPAETFAQEWIDRFADKSVSNKLA